MPSLRNPFPPFVWQRFHHVYYGIKQASLVVDDLRFGSTTAVVFHLLTASPLIAADLLRRGVWMQVGRYDDPFRACLHLPQVGITCLQIGMVRAVVKRVADQSVSRFCQQLGTVPLGHQPRTNQPIGIWIGARPLIRNDLDDFRTKLFRTFPKVPFLVRQVFVFFLNMTRHPAPQNNPIPRLDFVLGMFDVIGGAAGGQPIGIEGLLPSYGVVWYDETRHGRTSVACRTARVFWNWREPLELLATVCSIKAIRPSVAGLAGGHFFIGYAALPSRISVASNTRSTVVRSGRMPCSFS